MFLNIMPDLRALYRLKNFFGLNRNVHLSCLRILSDGSQKPQRPQGGGRELRNWDEVFKYNNWDNVVWDETQEAAAKSKVAENSEITLTSEEIEKLDEEAAAQWDAFYDIHQNRFFKDRHWLFTEFPELAHSTLSGKNSATPSPCASLRKNEDVKCNSYLKETTEESESALKKTCFENAVDRTNVASENQSSVKSLTIENDEANLTDNSSDVKPEESFPGKHAKFRILEVGCGVGNTVFPILKTNNAEDLFVYGCDFSSNAVDIVKASPDYEEKRCHAFVCDITCNEWNTPFPKESIDVIVCIFVLSAVHPDKSNQIVRNMAEYLRPGGLILFRDYGRYDLAQLRFKKGRCLSDNFYARGDGTRCYFFTQDEIRQLMTSAGLEEVQNLVDRRLQVNRGKRLTMYRVWVQGKYRKPLSKIGSEG